MDKPEHVTGEYYFSLGFVPGDNCLFLGSIYSVNYSLAALELEEGFNEMFSQV